jgi:hypothetical protein
MSAVCWEGRGHCPRVIPKAYPADARAPTLHSPPPKEQAVPCARQWASPPVTRLYQIHEYAWQPQASLGHDQQTNRRPWVSYSVYGCRHDTICVTGVLAFASLVLHDDPFGWAWAVHCLTSTYCIAPPAGPNARTHLVWRPPRGLGRARSQG